MALLDRWTRVSGSLLLVLAGFAMVPSPAHCGAVPDGPSHEHAHHGEQPAPSPDCPHCPPAQCASQTHCASVLVAAVTAVAAPVTLTASTPPFAAPASAWRSRSTAPPPPPPQPRA